MRFEVPQFIEVEDKIFGPLTWKQFIYVGGGLGLAAVLFFLTPFIVFVILGLPVAGLTFMLAFLPVNNRPFSIFLEAAVRYFRGTRLYLWQKKGTGVYSGAYEAKNTPVQVGVYTPPTTTGNLSTLARKLEMKALTQEK